MFLGLLQSYGLEPSQSELGFTGDLGCGGLLPRKLLAAGWKSSSLTMVGVMKMSRFNLVVLFDSLRNAYPRRGMSPRSGTLV